MGVRRTISVRVFPILQGAVRDYITSKASVLLVSTPDSPKPKFVYASKDSAPAMAVREKLDHIFSDGRVDPLENYNFYVAIATCAGKDHILQPEELIQLGRFYIPSLFKKQTTDGDRRKALDLLAEAQQSMKFFLNILHNLHTHQKKTEQSYFNFVSAENALGLASWFTRDGHPPSSGRLKGTTLVVSELEDQLMGLEILLESIEMGLFPENNFLVQKYLNGPFADFIGLHAYLINGANGPYKGRMQRSMRGLVSLAMSCNAEDAAILLAKSARRFIPDVQFFFEDLLPSGWERFRSGALTDFANSTLSLHHLLGYASGGILGHVVMRGAAARSAVTAASGNLAARIAVPGILFINSSASSGTLLNGTLRVVGNFAAESIKFGAIMAAGQYIGDTNGRHVAGFLYMGTLGFVGSLGIQALSHISREVVAPSDVPLHVPAADPVPISVAVPKPTPPRTLRVSALSEPTPPAKRASRPKTPAAADSIPPKGTPWRNGRPGEKTPPNEQTPPPMSAVRTPPSAPSVTELLLRNPPDTLSLETIRIVTQNRVLIHPRAWKDMMELYKTTPNIRIPLLRRLSEVNGRMDKNWKMLTSVEKGYDARVGMGHRILIQRRDGQFWVYRIDTRENLNRWGSWEPPPFNFISF